MAAIVGFSSLPRLARWRHARATLRFKGPGLLSHDSTTGDQKEFVIGSQ
jgi:hypothetical protein